MATKHGLTVSRSWLLVSCDALSFFRTRICSTNLARSCFSCRCRILSSLTSLSRSLKAPRIWRAMLLTLTSTARSSTAVCLHACECIFRKTRMSSISRTIWLISVSSWLSLVLTRTSFSASETLIESSVLASFFSSSRGKNFLRAARSRRRAICSSMSISCDWSTWSGSRVRVRVRVRATSASRTPPARGP